LIVLRRPSLRPLLSGLGSLCLLGCVSANETGSAYNSSDGANTGGAHDASEASPDLPVDAPADQPAPADAGETAAPDTDVTANQCTPPCAAPSACNAGVCLCPENCAEDPLFETQTPATTGELVGGGRFLYLAVNGPQASIRRFDLQTRIESVVESAGLEVATFALDSDSMGNLLWCSDVLSDTGRTGQLVYGTQVAESGPCTDVRRRNNFIYYKGGALFRKTFDPTSSRERISTEPMDTFEIAGDHLYFVDPLAQEAVLKRLPLADPAAVETITRRSGTSFLRLLPDSAHVYLIADGQILKVAQTPGAQAETFWQEAGPEAWAMAQTDTHLYWSATTAAGATDCSEAQILRRPKAGGPVTALARYPGFCAGQVVRIGGVLYAAIWQPPPAASTRILRIRL
jgi:hypothetical protein